MMNLPDPESMAWLEVVGHGFSGFDSVDEPDGDADLGAGPDHEPTEAERVLGVQRWMALDLHMALGHGTDAPPEFSDPEYAERSWADWWADLLAEARMSVAEVERLSRWKGEALPVMDGLQELGRALGLPPGARITGPMALAEVQQRATTTAKIRALHSPCGCRVEACGPNGRCRSCQTPYPCETARLFDAKGDDRG